MESAPDGVRRASVPPPGWVATPAAPAPNLVHASPSAARRVPVSGLRKAIVVLAALLTAAAVLFAIGVLGALAKVVVTDPNGFRAGAVITLTAVAVLAIWLPFWTWRTGNWLARLGIKISCDRCAGELAVTSRRCACGDEPRRSPDAALTLRNRLAAPWPAHYAPIGFVLSAAIVLTVTGLLLALHVHLTVLQSVGLVDATLVSVAVALARRTTEPQPWQFGLRQTSLKLAVKTDLIAFGSLVTATAVYYGLFGPFTSGKVSFAGNPDSAGLIVAAVIFAPAAEEFFFRGFVYGTLRQRLRWQHAALATTAMFVLAHWLSRYPLWALVPIALLSIASCLVYERTGSIWPCMILHAANNASIFASPVLAVLVSCAIVVAAVAVLQRTGSWSGEAPSWLVPAVAGAACAGLLGLAGAFKASPRPSVDSVSNAGPVYSPVGFRGGGTPATGSFAASGVVTSAAGYGNLYPGVTEQRLWSIHRSCGSAAGCVYLVTRQTGDGSLTGPLVDGPYGWEVTFPAEILSCGERDGYQLTWAQHSAFLIRFSAGSRVLDAVERIFSYAPQCGQATALWRWHAIAVRP